MYIGIVGGGINGLCSAWHLAKQGHHVDLYERNQLMQATSSASSKLLHGGLRYLENGEFRLVREALRERDLWLKRCPELTSPLRLVMPIFQRGRRSRLMVGIGLYLYEKLAGKSRFPGAYWLTKEDLLARDPELHALGLLGGYEFSDAQMDDQKLGLWVAEQAVQAGAKITENLEITKVKPNGEIEMAEGNHKEYDRVINIAGPWAVQLLKKSNLTTPYTLDLVRGSHLILEKPCTQAYLFEVPNERRIFFVLPWYGQTLLGTTEVRQTLSDNIECSAEEQSYLLRAYQYYKPDQQPIIVKSRFSGVRPLLTSATDPSRATREYAIHRTDKLITVLGGKWTTAMALAERINATLQ